MVVRSTRMYAFESVMNGCLYERHEWMLVRVTRMVLVRAAWMDACESDMSGYLWERHEWMRVRVTRMDACENDINGCLWEQHEWMLMRATWMDAYESDVNGSKRELYELHSLSKARLWNVVYRNKCPSFAVVFVLHAGDASDGSWCLRACAP